MNSAITSFPIGLGCRGRDAFSSISTPPQSGRPHGTDAHRCHLWILRQYHERLLPHRGAELLTGSKGVASRAGSQMERGQTYCIVDMVPTGFMFTGPTMREYRVVDRLVRRNCPKDAVVIPEDPGTKWW